MSSARSFHETFYGTPTEDGSGRRRGKKRHSKAANEEPQNEVVVTGVHYRSFDDDSMAAFVNSATALVPWNGDSKLLIDRYDVRHLLQDLTGIRRRRARPPSPDATKEELDYERYRDVEGLENPSPPEDELKNKDDGGYQTVGFNYGSSGDQATRKARAEDTLYSPPFFVPEHLRMKIPTSTKVHQIMAGTAKYVIEHGGQAEIVLRVKQANNPTFGFLMPGHHDHEYFRFLVAHPEHVGIGPTAQQEAVPEVAAPASSEEAEGGLSLLGMAYGDADEDEEEEDKGGDAYRVQTEKSQIVAADDLENVDDVTKQLMEVNSDNGATSKGSSTIHLTTSCRAENAANDTRDSLEVPLGSEPPKTGGLSGEVPVHGMVDSLPGSQERVPPGIKASSSGSGEMQGHEGHCQSEDIDNQVVPPYKEPPIQLCLIINKMVEFISRNGKEFEAIVKDRDKSDHRFSFFLPWDEYHPYYAKELESAMQAQLSAETDTTGIPSTSKSPNPLQGPAVVEKDEGTGSSLNGFPFLTISQKVESNGANGEGGISDMAEREEEKAHNVEGGMGFDAVFAAVRFATQGRPLAVEGNHESHSWNLSNGNEGLGIGSDEAVLAAIRAATGRTKLDSSESVSEKEIGSVAGPNGPDVEDARDPAQTSTVSLGAGVGDTQDPIQTSTLSGSASVDDSRDPIGNATTLPHLTAEVPVGLDEDHGVVPHVVSKATGVSPGVERDSPQPQLTTPDKRKAERLKKAKLFAAMIKDKNASLTNLVQLSGSSRISAPILDRRDNVSVALESTTLKSTGEVSATYIETDHEMRNQPGDTQLHVASEADKGLVDSSLKQRKHKVKSNEEEERKRKHRHRRKKQTNEKGNESKHSPAAEKGRDKDHDHYQDGERKESKHDREPEGRAKDSKQGLSKGKLRSDRGFQDFEDRTEEYEAARKDRSHYTNDTDRRKDSKYRYEAEQKKRRDRDREDSEGARRESRHVYDSEEDRRGDRQKHHRSRHGYDSAEERRGDRHKQDIDWKRNDRSRHDSDEKRNGDRYGYDSDEIWKEKSRSDGKRKKRPDRADESDDKDGRRNEQRTKKSRQQGGEFVSPTGHIHVERQNTLRQNTKEDRKLCVVSPVKQDALPQTSVTQMRVGDAKSTLSSADVPDDIRAKVRAMLAMM